MKFNEENLKNSKELAYQIYHEALEQELIRRGLDEQTAHEKAYATDVEVRSDFYLDFYDLKEKWIEAIHRDWDPDYEIDDDDNWGTYDFAHFLLYFDFNLETNCWEDRECNFHDAVFLDSQFIMEDN